MGGAREGEGGCVVGIDGGATRTRIALADSSGTVLARAEGPGSLLGVGRDEEVARGLSRRIRELVGEAGVPLPVRAVCAGLAGAAGRTDSTRECELRILRSGVCEAVRVIPDAEVAFCDAFGEPGEGILIVSGTGSIGVARVRGSSEGAPLLRVGGWGALIGDEGSGYELGLKGLRAAIRGEEARGAATSLTAAVLGAIGATSVRDAFDWVGSAGKSGVAALAPVVVREAEAGDREARAIVAHAVQSIVAHALALRTLHFASAHPPGVALVGGLVEEGAPLGSSVREAMATAGFEVLTGPVEPVRGAVRLALRM